MEYQIKPKKISRVSFTNKQLSNIPHTDINRNISYEYKAEYDNEFYIKVETSHHEKKV